MKPEDVLRLIQCKIEDAKISAVIQNSGTSIFLPSGWSHSVVTETETSCFLKIIEFNVNDEELQYRHKQLSHHSNVGVRRGDVATPSSSK